LASLRQNYLGATVIASRRSPQHDPKSWNMAEDPPRRRLLEVASIVLIDIIIDGIGCHDRSPRTARLPSQPPRRPAGNEMLSVIHMSSIEWGANRSEIHSVMQQAGVPIAVANAAPRIELSRIGRRTRLLGLPSKSGPTNPPTKLPSIETIAAETANGAHALPNIASEACEMSPNDKTARPNQTPMTTQLQTQPQKRPALTRTSHCAAINLGLRSRSEL
jgi:hypothetical protein